MFIQHLTTQAQNEAKTERVPRKTIQYKDVANAVSHHDNLEFLEDIVPKTQSYKAVNEKAASTRAAINGDRNSDAKKGGQKLLINGSGMISLGNGTEDNEDVSMID